jgi:hypothetical protein
MTTCGPGRRILHSSGGSFDRADDSLYWAIQVLPAFDTRVLTFFVPGAAVSVLNAGPSLTARGPTEVLFLEEDNIYEKMLTLIVFVLSCLQPTALPGQRSSGTGSTLFGISFGDVFAAFGRRHSPDLDF